MGKRKGEREKKDATVRISINDDASDMQDSRIR